MSIMRKARIVSIQPNDLLKQERLLRGWSQVYIANALDTDGYTVNRWERGRAQPSPYFRQKLCALFGKNAFEMGLLAPRHEDSIQAAPFSITGPPPSSLRSVPYSHNPYFTGREDILQTLHTRLKSSQSNAPLQTIALSGLAGCGKTQLAIEYAYRYMSEYSMIVWTEAKSIEHIAWQIARCAEITGLPPEPREGDQQLIMETVRQWLATHGNWLLIWDGLENLDMLSCLLPLLKHGTLLITTRLQSFGTLAHGITLEPMKHEEGIQFVLRRAKVLALDATEEQMRQSSAYNAASRLVEIMGGLPLALDQIGAYADETGCSLSNYLQRYHQQRMAMLRQRGVIGIHHPHSVAETFLFVKELIEQESATALDLLFVCASLHAEAIPEELLLEGAADLGLQSIINDGTQFDRAIAILRSHSLLQRSPETHTLAIHSLVQTVLLESLSGPERAKWLRRVTAALNVLFPEITSSKLRLYERFLPHVLSIAIQQTDELDDCHLTDGLPNGIYYPEAALRKLRSCERLLPHVLSIAAKRADETDDYNLAEVLQKAAHYLRECGQEKQAETLYRRALHIKEYLLGSEHADVLTLHHALALLSHEATGASYQHPHLIGEQEPGAQKVLSAFNQSKAV